ncbi:sensor histidine kinase, partial [Microbacterium marinilacus]
MTPATQAGGAGGRAHADPWERYGWLMAAVWLIFLIYPVLALAASEQHVAWRVLGWAALVAFAVLYVTGLIIGMRAGWGRAPRTVYAIFAATVVCVLGTLPAIGTQALSFIPFLMAYASYGMGRAWHWIASIGGVAIAVVVLVATGRMEGHLQVLIIVVLMALVNTINTWLIGRSVAAEEVRLRLATSEERGTIARDVHDLLGHSLTVVKLKAELAARLVDAEPARAKAELTEIARLAGEAIAGVRTTATGLRATDLRTQLDASEAALGSAGVAVRTEGDIGALSPAQSLTAAWVLREATTNILRHARAETVRIAIEPGTLTVDDDGT